MQQSHKQLSAQQKINRTTTNAMMLRIAQVGPLMLKWDMMGGGDVGSGTALIGLLVVVLVGPFVEAVVVAVVMCDLFDSVWARRRRLGLGCGSGDDSIVINSGKELSVIGSGDAIGTEACSSAVSVVIMFGTTALCTHMIITATTAAASLVEKVICATERLLDCLKLAAN